MLFFEGQFLVFLLFLSLALACIRSTRGRVVLLLVASYVFYAAWDPRFLALIFGSTCLDYWIGRTLPSAGPERRRGLLTLSLLGNLGSLAVFKYLDFGIATLRALLGVDWPILELTLPVGISFYTFQSMSYTLDIYRGRLEPEPRFLRFALFVGFFPQLVAGPIIRAAVFLPQIDSALARVGGRLTEAVPLFVLGLFKKVAIADNLAPIADPVFAAPGQYGGADVALATLAFAGQIYGDFSGYTDMAIALGLVLGFEFPANFRSPYLATGPQDFWRRWHISLSTWLRDYLYIPLGGSRHGFSRTLFALMATMLLGGLWHGAAWTFVIWGAYHGALLAGQRAAQRWLPRRVTTAPAALASLAFLPLTLFGWMIFRAESTTLLMQMFEQLAVDGPATLASPGLLGALAFVTLEHALGETARRRDWSFASWPRASMAAAGVGLVLCTALKPSFPGAFIYFQF